MTSTPIPVPFVAATSYPHISDASGGFLTLNGPVTVKNGITADTSTVTGTLNAASATTALGSVTGPISLTKGLTADSANITSLQSGNLTSTVALLANAVTLQGVLKGISAQFTGLVQAGSMLLSGNVTGTSANFTGTLFGVAATFSGLVTAASLNVTGCPQRRSRDLLRHADDRQCDCSRRAHRHERNLWHHASLNSSSEQLRQRLCGDHRSGSSRWPGYRDRRNRPRLPVSDCDRGRDGRRNHRTIPRSHRSLDLYWRDRAGPSVRDDSV